jgi:hypothetical protein
MTAYFKAAVEHACAEIVSAPNGAQEMTLHRESYGIGGLVAVGTLDCRDMLDALIEAARRMPTYRDRWVGLERKIEASLRRGMQRPRTPLEGCRQTRQYQPRPTASPGKGRRPRRCRDAVAIDAVIEGLAGRARE